MLWAEISLSRMATKARPGGRAQQVQDAQRGQHRHHQAQEVELDAAVELPAADARCPTCMPALPPVTDPSAQTSRR